MLPPPHNQRSATNNGQGPVTRGWSYPLRCDGLAPTRLHAPSPVSHNFECVSLRQLPEHGIVLIVAIDDSLRVGGLHRLIEKRNLWCDPRNHPVESLDFVDRFLDQLSIRGAEEAALAVRIVVAKLDQLLVALLQRFEPGKTFVRWRRRSVQRDLRTDASCQ